MQLKKNTIVKMFALLGLSTIIFGCGNKGESSSSGSSISFPTSGSDPLAAYLWHLKDLSGNYVNGNSPANDIHINLGSTHSSYTGKGITVVISDGQIDLDHPELDDNANISLSKNYSNDAPYFGDPYDQDDFDSHATGVSSLTAGGKNNGVGGFGVAPEANLVGYNFLNSSSSESKFIDQAQVEGGEAVFNYSYGPMNCAFENMAESDIFLNTLRAETISNNNLYVVAAGNEFAVSSNSCNGSNHEYFGNANFDQDRTQPYFLLVGATNAEGLSAQYSTPGANVWISAPGGDLASESGIGLMVADLIGCDAGFGVDSFTNFDLSSSSENPFCSFFSEAQGTSYAAPIVTGAIAVLKEVNPDLTWRDIKHILAATAVKIDPTAGATDHPGGEDLPSHEYQQGWVTNDAGYHFHPWFGFGLLDLTAAVALADNPDFDLQELKSTDTLEDEPNYSEAPNSPIPNNSIGATSTINIDKHDLVIEHVLVKVNITHPRPSDIGIELVSAKNTVTKLMNINSYIASTSNDDVYEVYFGVNGFYGERSNGDWEIRVVDGKSGETGTLNSWSITIIGHKGPDALTPDPAPATSFSRSGANLTWTASPDGDVARYEICIAPTQNLALGCKDGDWRSILAPATSVSLTSYVMGGLRVDEFENGVEYTAKIRAVDTDENESSIATTTWTH